MNYSPQKRAARTRELNRLIDAQLKDDDARPARVKRLRAPIDDTDLLPDLYRSPRGRRKQKPHHTHD